MAFLRSVTFMPEVHCFTQASQVSSKFDGAGQPIAVVLVGLAASMLTAWDIVEQGIIRKLFDKFFQVLSIV
jgi:hypothetical protein